jgi:hypothetical protein
MNGPHPVDELEALSLDALEESERLSVSAHVARCPACAAVLDGYREVAAGLALRLPPVEPSERLRGRLLDAARRESGTIGPTPLRGSLNGHHAAAPSVVQCPRRFPWRIPRSVVAAAVALLALGWGVSLQLQVNALRAENAQLSQRDARYTRVVQVLSADAFQARDLEPQAGGSAHGRVYFDAAAGSGMLMVRDLPPPPEGMVYRVWLVRDDGERDSAAAFRTGADGWGYTLLQTDEPFGEYQTIGITEEASGSQEPSQPPLLRATLHQS